MPPFFHIPSFLSPPSLSLTLSSQRFSPFPHSPLLTLCLLKSFRRLRSSSRSSLLRCSEVNLVAYCSAVSSIRPLRCSVFPLPLLRCSRSWSPYCGAVRPSCCGAAFTIFPCKLRQQFPLPQIPAGSFVSPRRGAVFYHNPPAAVQLDIDFLVFIVHEKEVMRDLSLIHI